MTRYLRSSLLAVMLLAGSARADLIISAPSFKAEPFSTGNFDILLTNNGTAAVGIGAFSFDIFTASTDIDFRSASTTTSVAPYIYVGNSFVTINGLPFFMGGRQELTASDTTNNGVAPFIAPGTTVSLGEVSYFLDFSSTPILVMFRSTGTSLSDQHGNLLPATTVSGSIESIPEPSAAKLLIGSLAMLIFASRRSRARALA